MAKRKKESRKESRPSPPSTELLTIELRPATCDLIYSILDEWRGATTLKLSRTVDTELLMFINELRARVQHAAAGMPDRRPR